MLLVFRFENVGHAVLAREKLNALPALCWLQIARCCSGLRKKQILLNIGRRKICRSIRVIGVNYREEVESFAEKNDLAIFSYETTEEMLPDKASCHSRGCIDLIFSKNLF